MGAMRNDPTLPQYDHLLESRFGLNGVQFSYTRSVMQHMGKMDLVKVRIFHRGQSQPGLTQRIWRYLDHPSDLIHPEYQHKSREQPEITPVPVQPQEIEKSKHSLPAGFSVTMLNVIKPGIRKVVQG